MILPMVFENGTVEVGIRDFVLAEKEMLGIGGCSYVALISTFEAFPLLS